MATRFFYGIVQALGRILCRILYNHRVYGVSNYGDCPGGALLCANHSSFLDPLLVAISAPDEVFFLGRKSLFEYFFLKKCCAYFRALPLGKGSTRESFRMIGTALADGGKVLIFPEGTRGDGQGLYPLQLGAAFLMKRTGKPIVPVYLSGAWEVWPRTKKWPRWFGKTACVFGSPIRLEGLPPGATLEQISDRLALAINGLRDWLEAGAVGNPP